MNIIKSILVFSLLYQRSRWHSRSSSYGSRSQYIRWNWNNVPRRDQWSKLFVETIEGTKHTPYLKSETTFYYITNSGGFRHWDKGGGKSGLKNNFFQFGKKIRGAKPSRSPPWIHHWLRPNWILKCDCWAWHLTHVMWEQAREADARGRRPFANQWQSNDVYKIPHFNIHSFYRAAHIHYQSLWR